MFGIHDLALFVISGLMLNMMPGPDSLLIMTRSAAQGWRAGFAATWGIGAGTMVHVLAAALGLSAILATSATAFMVVKYVGAAYILYMAYGLLRSKRSERSEHAVAEPSFPRRRESMAPLLKRAMGSRLRGNDGGRIFAQGFLTNVLNPKVALFFLAFVPQFIDAASPTKALAFITLGVIFNVNGMLWCHALALFTATASARMTLSPTVSFWLNRATGGLFIWLGVKLALAQSR